jgi:hypothetical protein
MQADREEDGEGRQVKLDEGRKIAV